MRVSDKHQERMNWNSLLEPPSEYCLVNLIREVKSLDQKTGEKVYLDQGWIMNWDQLKVVGIVPEVYPIICEFLKASKTRVVLTPAASYIEELSKYVRTFNCYELTRRNRTRSITNSALSTHSY